MVCSSKLCRYMDLLGARIRGMKNGDYLENPKQRLEKRERVTKGQRYSLALEGKNKHVLFFKLLRVWQLNPKMDSKLV